MRRTGARVGDIFFQSNRFQFRTAARPSGAGFKQSVELAREFAARLPPAEAARMTASLDQVNVRVIRIAAELAAMKFDIGSFTVTAGEDIEIEFVNLDEMPHNLLITKQGAMEIVSLKAEAMVKDPDAFNKSQIPVRLGKAVRELAPEGRPILFLITHALSPAEDADIRRHGVAATPLVVFDRAITDENFFVYRVEAARSGSGSRFSAGVKPIGRAGARVSHFLRRSRRPASARTDL